MGNSGIGSATCSRRLPGSRRGWGRAAWVGLVVLGLAFARAGWAQRSYDDLDDAVRDLTRTLVERGELVALFSAADLAGKRVLVKSDDFFETETGFRLPLSKVLSRKCATELTRSRVPVALEGTDEDAVRVLHGRWKRVPRGRLDLTLFVAEPVKGRGEPVALVSVEGRVPVEGIRPEDIEPTLEHWGRYLVRRLDRGVGDSGRRTVRIQPLSVRGEGTAKPDELGRELADWLGEALLESRWFEVVEPAPAGSAAAVQVDGELLGRVSVRSQHVKVSVRVLDNERRRVTAASVELSNALFDETLFGAVVTGGGEEDDETPPSPSTSISDEVTAQLAECAAHFGANRLSRPPERNAAQCYAQVLELERGNTEALAGLERVEERYVERAKEAIRRGALAEARAHVERLGKLNPEHPRVPELQGDITGAEHKAEERRAAAEAEARRKRAEGEAKRKAEERRIAELTPEMVHIEGGCFRMGSPESEVGRDSDERQHQVCVEAFSIGKYEVTFAEYDRFAEATGQGRHDDAGWGRGRRPAGSGRCPVAEGSGQRGVHSWRRSASRWRKGCFRPASSVRRGRAAGQSKAERPDPPPKLPPVSCSCSRSARGTRRASVGRMHGDATGRFWSAMRRTTRPRMAERRWSGDTESVFGRRWPDGILRERRALWRSTGDWSRTPVGFGPGLGSGRRSPAGTMRDSIGCGSSGSSSRIRQPSHSRVALLVARERTRQ